MNPLDTLKAALAAQPDDDAARCALIDELMEQRGMCVRGARSLAGRIVNAARNARLVAHALAILAPERDGSIGTKLAIYEASGLPHPDTAPIDVIAGNHPPTVTGQRGRCEFPDGTHCHNPAAAFGAGIRVIYTPESRRVTVGANWILENC